MGILITTHSAVFFSFGCELMAAATKRTTFIYPPPLDLLCGDVPHAPAVQSVTCLLYFNESEVGSQRAGCSFGVTSSSISYFSVHKFHFNVLN